MFQGAWRYGGAVPGAVNPVYSVPPSGSNSDLVFMDSGLTVRVRFSRDTGYMAVGMETSAAEARIQTDGNLAPWVTNSYTLGTQASGWYSLNADAIYLRKPGISTEYSFKKSSNGIEVVVNGLHVGTIGTDDINDYVWIRCPA